MMDGLQAYLYQWLKGEIEPPVTKLIGIKLVAYEDQTARLELRTLPQHYNPMGIVHGGILCDLADAAMGVAMASVLQEGETFSTIEINIRYFRPVKETLLTANAQVTFRSHNTGHVECELQDERNRLIAKASSTCLIQVIN